MNYTHHEKELEKLIGRNGILSVKDFSDLYSGVPMTSVYAYIRRWVKEGKIIPVGKGLYTSTPKPDYAPDISPRMKEINRFLIEHCEGVNFCLLEQGDNLILSTYKSDMETVSRALRERGEKVARKKDAEMFLDELKNYILLEPLITEAPVIQIDGVNIPSVEKELVDRISNKNIGLHPFDFQKIAEVYPLNYNRLRRYAARRGVSSETSSLVASLDQERIEMFTKVQKFLPRTGIRRAWVFGSFARGEESSQSDLDLLVDYDKGLSLLTTIRYKLDLEQIIGRKVDLIENGYLKPFATASAEKDKYLIYERKN